MTAEEKPQVVDKRRFANRLSDSDVEQLVDQGSLPVGYQHEPDGEGSWDLITRGDFSPSSDPNKPSTMDCGTALRLVGEGKRVTRLAWDNPEIYLIMFMWGSINPKTPNGKYLSIHHADGVVNPLYLNDGDLLGDDWVLV